MADDTKKLPRDFADLLSALCEAGAEFLVVGVWAVILHGHVRATDDLDIFVRATPENAGHVYAALNDFGAPLAAHQVTPQHFATEGNAYRFGLAPFKIEVLTKISGVTFDEALVDARTFDVEGRPIRYIGRAALIQNKRAAGSHHRPEPVARGVRRGRRLRRLPALGPLAPLNSLAQRPA